MKYINKLLILFLLLVPLNTFAYSKYLVPGGDNLGITVSNKGVLIVGFYNDINSNLNLGDTIVSINNKEIISINDMIETINKSDNINIKVGYIRNNIYQETMLNLIKENGLYKTGLYVKDNITGIGTLTYIDPSNNRYGALGHSINESSTNIKFDIRAGNIFKSIVTSIDKSRDGYAGSKNARFYFDTVYGSIDKNTDTGIYGNYTSKYDLNNLLEIKTLDEINLGDAFIRTTIDNNLIKDYKIEIVDINTTGIKNILFHVKDPELIDKTGGIVKGMSGSPIIQDNKIIGAVTHTVISDNTKGFGISIVKMLEEDE